MKSGQIYISNPRYQHTLEPFADLFGIERVPVTGALTDKFVNQLQIAIMAKGPSISRLPAMVEYPTKRIFRRVVGQGRISYLMSTQRWYTQISNGMPKSFALTSLELQLVGA